MPPEQLYESPSLCDALGRLTYAADHQLFAVLTSDAGCEKGLMYAFQQNKRLIDDHMIRFVMDHVMLGGDGV